MHNQIYGPKCQNYACHVNCLSSVSEWIITSLWDHHLNGEDTPSMGLHRYIEPIRKN